MPKISTNSWTGEILEVIGDILTLEEELIATLEVAIHQGIDTQDYEQVNKLLPNIRNTARLLTHTAQDLIELKPEMGRPPKWWHIGEEVKHFSLQTQRAILKITAEEKGNWWGVIGKRLEQCSIRCQDLRAQMIEAIPPKHRPKRMRIAQLVANLLKTIEMGETKPTQAGGGRWRSSGRR